MTGEVVFKTDVMQMTGLSRPTITKYIKEKGFPKPSTIGYKSAWYKKDVQAWIDEQMSKGEEASE